MVSESRLLFIDIWGWLVLADGIDPHNQRADKVRRQFAASGQLVTTDFVLDEMITRLYGWSPFPTARTFCAAVFEAERVGLLLIERITAQRFQSAYALRMRSRDKPRISFTDLTSFVVMKDLGIRDVLMANQHFRNSGLGFHLHP